MKHSSFFFLSLFFRAAMSGQVHTSIAKEGSNISPAQDVT